MSALVLPPYKPPFPYFGGKSRCAHLIWDRFGGVRNYVEPFFGSGAALFLRPRPFEGIETVNDMDGFLANFWRASRADPEAVARWADWPVNENDLHARHSWLNGRRDDITRRLEGDPEFFDAKVAGWWVWGLCCWIGRDYCSGKGPWRVVDGELINGGNGGKGVNRQLPHLGNAGQGVNRQPSHVSECFAVIADRLSRVRVCCGDWSRVCGTTPTTKQGLTGVFLDPPYADTAARDPNLYACESLSVAHDARRWAIEHGDDPKMRICLAGYEGEHAMPETWEAVPWKAKGGFASQSLSHDNPNARRERLWFSPHCLKPAARSATPLFATAGPGLAAARSSNPKESRP